MKRKVEIVASPVELRKAFDKKYPGFITRAKDGVGIIIHVKAGQHLAINSVDMGLILQDGLNEILIDDGGQVNIMNDEYLLPLIGEGKDTVVELKE